MTQAAQNGAESTPEPTPAPTFDALALSPDVRKAIDALGYTHPSPVQLAVFEPASRGKSLVVQARTGTGKTAAFGLPIVDALVKRGQPNVQALILTPTRELALQVAREIEQLAQFRGTKVIAIYGGAPIGRQVEELEGGAQVVCGTPGRVLDHLRRGTMDPKNIRIFVLDEADEMLSMGFAKELNAIIEMLPKERQGLYFSATLPPDVERLANSHLKDPEWITLSSDQTGALTISHFVYLVREGDKRGALARIIEVENPESAVVFCNTKDETERVAEMLKSKGYDADWLNGDLEQRERERVMQAVREGKIRFLVATDVAARGIDISHLTHVINADFPESAEAYVHRTGRTGRAGRTGTAISVVGPKDVGHLYMLRLTYKIRPIERMLPTQGELRTRAEADMIAFLADAYAGKAQDPAHQAVARRLLTHDSAERIITGLLADHLGASNLPQEAADARRAKNPAPEAAPAAGTVAPRAEARRDERPRRDDRPRDDRGPRNDRDRGPRGDRDRGRGDRNGRRDDRGPRDQAQAQVQQPHAARQPRPRNDEMVRPGRPHSELAGWEPTADADDDMPLFSVEGEEGTKPGIGSPRPLSQRGGAPSEGNGGRRGDRGRGRDRDRRPRSGEDDVAGDAKTLDLGRPPLPSFSVEGEEPRPARDARPQRDARPPREPRAPREPREPETHTDDPSFQNVFLNVGRRDGLQPEDIQKIVVDNARLAAEDVGHIRLRDRITFIGIRKEHAEEAIKALIGVAVGERTLNAEVARER